MDIGYLYRSDDGVEAHIYAPRPFQAPRLLRLGLDGAPVDFRRISDMQDQQAASGQKP